MAHSHIPQQSVVEPDAARYIGYTPAALKKWRWEGRGPAFIRVGRSVRYRITDLDRWLEAHRVETRESRAVSGTRRRGR